MKRLIDEDEGCTARAVLDPGLDAIGAAQHVGGEDDVGAPLGDGAAFGDDDDAVAMAYGQIDVVHRNQCNGETVEGYEVVNLFAEYVPASFENLTLRLDINKVFDETYIRRGTYGQEYPSVTPLNGPGRSFLLSAKAQF